MKELDNHAVVAIVRTVLEAGYHMFLLGMKV